MDYMESNDFFSGCQHGCRRHNYLEVMNDDFTRFIEERDNIDILILGRRSMLCPIRDF